jgi:hypothetical protein
MAELRIYYQKNGKAVSDFEIEEWFDNLRPWWEKEPKPTDNASLNVYVSTSPPIWRVLLAIVEDELDCNEVVFIFEGKELRSDPYGAMKDWPKGFCEAEGGLIIETSIKGMQKELNRRAEMGE